VTSDGSEWIVDARGCDPARLADLTAMQSLFACIVDELRLTPVAEPVWHVFPDPGGITGVVALAESHLTVHTFPEHRALCLNLFCCKPRPEWPWRERLYDRVGAEHVDVRRVERRYVQDSRNSHQSMPPAPMARAASVLP
jgi:S-adenosylmethionine decarboxylase